MDLPESLPTEIKILIWALLVFGGATTTALIFFIKRYLEHTDKTLDTITSQLQTLINSSDSLERKVASHDRQIKLIFKQIGKQMRDEL